MDGTQKYPHVFKILFKYTVCNIAKYFSSVA